MEMQFLLLKLCLRIEKLLHMNDHYEAVFVKIVVLFENSTVRVPTNGLVLCYLYIILS